MKSKGSLLYLQKPTTSYPESNPVYILLNFIILMLSTNADIYCVKTCNI